MSNWIAVLFLGLAGFSLGGAYSLQRQGKPLLIVIGLAVAGLMCLAAGALYL